MLVPDAGLLLKSMVLFSAFVLNWVKLAVIV
jgi:hypothetical protein